MESANKTPKWLRRLQQNSWNLELLISGFSIFLLFQGLGMLEEVLTQVNIHFKEGALGQIPIIPLLICYLGCKILIFNLILHILLRGFWIGAIGLSSVQSNRDFSTLRYAEKFTKRLNHKAAPLDGLILRLDNFCSAIFAFTFLIVLMLISFFAVILVLLLISGILSKTQEWFFPEQEHFFYSLEVIISLVFGVTGLLYFLDTLTLGGLKKIKWLQIIYYPIYRFFNLISFSFTYNSIYYHLLTRFPKRYLTLVIFFYFSILLIGPFFIQYNPYRFFPDNETSNELFTRIYDDERSSEQIISHASIPSLIIKSQFLPVFIRYNTNQNDVLLINCQDYDPSKKSDLISAVEISSKGILFNSSTTKEAEPEKLLNCLQQHYQLYLNDTLYLQPDFYFFEQNNQIGEKGLKTVLDVAHLPRGKNLLKITQMAFDTSEVFIEKDYITIPFWKE